MASASVASKTPAKPTPSPVMRADEGYDPDVPVGELAAWLDAYLQPVVQAFDQVDRRLRSTDEAAKRNGMKFLEAVNDLGQRHKEALDRIDRLESAVTYLRDARERDHKMPPKYDRWRTWRAVGRCHGWPTQVI